MAHDDLFPDQYLKSLKALEGSIGLSAQFGLVSALNSTTSYQRAAQEAAASMSTYDSCHRFINDALAQNQALEDAVKAFSRPTLIEQALGSSRIAEMAAAAMSRNSAIDDAMKSFASQQELYKRALGSLDIQSSITSAFSGIGNYQAEAALKRILESSGFLFENPDYLRDIAASVADLELDETDSEDIEEELGQAVCGLDDVRSAKSFADWFKALPPYVQAFLWFFFLQVIVPQINSISANLLTPMVQAVMEQEHRSERDKINDVRKIRFDLEGIDTEGLRFISGTNVRLRSQPSTKAEVLAELDLGQVVAVLSKERNWIEIQYEYEDGETKVGWVFARYTSKFKN